MKPGPDATFYIGFIAAAANFFALCWWVSRAGKRVDEAIMGRASPLLRRLGAAFSWFGAALSLGAAAYGARAGKHVDAFHVVLSAVAVAQITALLRGERPFAYRIAAGQCALASFLVGAYCLAPGPFPNRAPLHPGLVSFGIFGAGVLIAAAWLCWKAAENPGNARAHSS